MTAEASLAPAARRVSRPRVSAPAGLRLLRRLAVAAGIGWAMAFVVVGLAFRLQLYGDGSIFSYAVAVEDAWAFHFHNIPARMFAYLFASVPGEAYVHLTHDAHGGIALYGLMFFGAQLLGLAATWAADRSETRIVFAFACGSTACFCPFVFGFPTEMWMAHALFWPALALTHDAPRNIVGTALVFLALLALALTHEGALVLEVAILGTLALRGVRDAAFVRAVVSFFVVVLVWTAVKEAFVPDDYIVGVMHAAAFDFIDPAHLADSDFFVVMACAVAGYVVVALLLRRLSPTRSFAYALVPVLAALAVYWLRFDHALHTQNRYYLRTVLLIALPVLGGLAAAYALRGEGRLNSAVPLLPQLLDALRRRPVVLTVAGAIVLMSAVHAVETAKFVRAWTGYKNAVRALATGTAADPDLGDARFVSSNRISPDLNRLSWESTTHFLSVLVAPGFAPARLVIDPHAGYFWLPCERAKANENADRAIPRESRALVRVHACLHR